jgi:acyl-CoA thioester hydrolase
LTDIVPSNEIPTAESSFDLPSPHCIDVVVRAADIDSYRHVNNAVYVTWCDRAAWHHSAALGLPVERCLELNRGMAVLRTTIGYLRPALLDDVVGIATWLLPMESRLCVRRRFQILRKADGVTLARAEIDYACIVLSSGKPARWPQEFHSRYATLPEVLAASSDLPVI